MPAHVGRIAPGAAVEVVPALVGDACLSGALCLSAADDEGSAAACLALRGKAGGAAPPPYLHPRFYCVEAEEHCLVSGRAGRVSGEASREGRGAAQTTRAACSMQQADCRQVHPAGRAATLTLCHALGKCWLQGPGSERLHSCLHAVW